MAKLVFGLNQSLDGYVDHQEFAPGPSLFRHFTEQVRDLAGSVYGRRMYEVMHYWDEDRPKWDAEERDFAAAWRSQPKWVVSRSLKSVGPNASLVADDVEASRRLSKAGKVTVAQERRCRRASAGRGLRPMSSFPARNEHDLPSALRVGRQPQNGHAVVTRRCPLLGGKADMADLGVHALL